MTSHHPGMQYAVFLNNVFPFFKIKQNKLPWNDGIHIPLYALIDLNCILKLLLKAKR